jgi:bifunctional DNA-binding transcriptional regulator/antitoxin component of YhaV-PrlF toxin-antitoxin module
LSIVEIDDRGRLTLPKELRRTMDMNKVLIVNAGDHLKLIPIPEDPFKALDGVLSSEKSFKEHREPAESEAIHYARMQTREATQIMDRIAAKAGEWNGEEEILRWRRKG